MVSARASPPDRGRVGFRWFQHERHSGLCRFGNGTCTIGAGGCASYLVANERGRERERGTCTIASRADAARRSVVPRACVVSRELSLNSRSAIDSKARELCMCR